MGICATKVIPEDVAWSDDTPKYNSKRGLPFISIENDFQSVHNSPVAEPYPIESSFQFARFSGLTCDQSIQTEITIDVDANIGGFTTTIHHTAPKAATSFRRSVGTFSSNDSSAELRRLSNSVEHTMLLELRRKQSIRTSNGKEAGEDVYEQEAEVDDTREENKQEGYETDTDDHIEEHDDDDQADVVDNIDTDYQFSMSSKKELIKEKRQSIRISRQANAAVSLKTTVRAAKTDDGKKMVNEYVLLKKLGSGTYGKVKLCMHKETGQFLAMKIINRSLLNKVKRDSRGRPMKVNQIGLVMKEVAILKKLSHENVVQLHEVIDDPTDEKLFMIFEYVERGAVMKLGGGNDTDRPPFTDGAARKYFRELLAGLEYLHRNKVIHRDIKPENLLLDNNDKLKLTDFGVSHMFDGDDDILYTSAGTPAFLAPEACTVGQYKGKPSDIWSAGVTLYVMVFGTVPFCGSGILGTYNAILYEEPYYPDNADPRLINLLTKILTKNPDQRITMDDIKQHEWITDSGKWPFGSNCPIVEEPVNTGVTEQEVRDAIVEGRSMKMIDKFVLMSKVSRVMHVKAKGAKQRLNKRKLLSRASPSSNRGSRRSLRFDQTFEDDENDRRSLPPSVNVNLNGYYTEGGSRNSFKKKNGRLNPLERKQLDDLAGGENINSPITMNLTFNVQPHKSSPSSRVSSFRKRTSVRSISSMR